ncbi:MAG: aminopeptidase [Phycisphaerae bacterium]|jgi:aminopeptidase|nr:aminopeptidase [Phycisphaerae bacterium]MDP6154139.1 aminopeptidase [Phycisphaeraceae bacterium]
MPDPRLDQLARVITEYSVGVKPGQLVRIQGEPIATPFVEVLYEACLRAGAHPYVRLSPDALSEIFYEVASEEQLKHVSPIARYEIETIDVSIGLWAETNTKALSRIDAKRQSIASSARKEIMSIFMQRAAKKQLHWCGTLFPTLASAQDAEMSLRQYEDFVFGAGHLDKPDPVAVWRDIEQRQQHVVDYLNGRKQVHFQAANGTDLTVNVDAMTWINCCGHENFPDGEVFTGPNLGADDGGVNGVVRYSFPAVHHGREVHDIELTFEKGTVVKARASKNEDFLKEMLDQDEGASRLGEIAIGTNYNIAEYSKNTLFDEKIGGTFHAAVGAGYPETGNSNESGLHWDMVCDLRTGGTITVDGEVISRDGRFVFPGWPGNE